MMHASCVCEVFHSCFAAPYRTKLIGGAGEPLYQPAVNDGDWHVIYFREDFPSSALHEISHWSIAGKARRQLLDFGYWYEDERDADKQKAFEDLEIKPQALEWIFSRASGIEFRVSADNFNESIVALDRLRQEVRLGAVAWLQAGLPTRAQRFVEALVQRTGNVCALDPSTYCEVPQ